MSIHSTPAKPRHSIVSFYETSSSAPVAQENLKKLIEDDLHGAKWQRDAKCLARALSRKSLKANVRTLKRGEIDKISRYNIAIDALPDDDLRQIANSQNPQVNGFKRYRKERDSYIALAAYLNSCVEKSRSRFENLVGHYQDQLTFNVYDRPTGDGIWDANPLKPDVVGAPCSFGIKDRLWWSPKPEDHNHAVLIPVEIKSSFRDLVLQAATYARGLFSASPLRQHALVISFNHHAHEIRFLVFHRGGLTMSNPLYVKKVEDRMDILRLFMAVLSWNTPGQAGLPVWFNGTQMSIPRSINSAAESILFHVIRVLSYHLSIRGRNPRVSLLTPHVDVTVDSANNKDPCDSLVPVAQMFQPRRSPRIRKLEAAKAAAATAPAQLQKHKRSHQQEAEIEEKLEPFQAIEVQKSGGNLPVFVKQHISKEHGSRDIMNSEADLVVKQTWMPKGYVSVEGELFKKCGGMFGVATHIYSYLVCHEEGVPVTNHLLLEDAKPWVFTDENVDEHEEQDFRALWNHLSEYSGGSLLHAPTPRLLVLAILHAILGYRNIIFGGFQHRDISIGNVLFLEEPKKTKPLLDNLERASPDLRDLIQKLGINDQCHGFIIDGDLAIELKTYFADQQRNGSRSGTREFMSDDLLITSNYPNRPFLQSPMDDFFSFYYVAQWAAVFNEKEFPNAGSLSIPFGLKLLRHQLLQGDRDARSSATTQIQGVPLEEHECGRFLAACQPFLKHWLRYLKEINEDFWYRKHKQLVQGNVGANSGTIVAELENLTDKLVIGTLEIVDKHMSSTLPMDKWH